MSGVSIDRGYDAHQRLNVLATEAGYEATYLFDTAGRLSRIAEDHHHADFGYETGTEILDSVTVRRVGVPRLRHERSIDNIGRIAWVETIVDGATVVRRDYTHNDANQRTIVEHEDGRAWHYGYDSLGQVTSAHKRLSADPQSAILPGYSYGFTFDEIGNRETATRNSRTATYTPNLLNEYDDRTVPGYIEVLGEAHATATVTVDSQSTQRTGRDFRREISVANSATAVYSSIEVEAVFDSQTVDETRQAFLAKTPEAFVHDADGNLESDGRWTYEWDAENRLKAMETRASVATAFPALKQRLEFSYDFQGRRIQKVVKDWDTGSSGWLTTKDLRFVYDGWNLIEERDALDGDAMVRKHVWGPDMSGSMQGAGGVGGLLWTQTPTQTFAASSDANGNIVAWTNTATLAVAGRADYNPFGEPVVQTGVAKEMPFGFSTKYEDAETDLLYYGLRYQNPVTGRFLNRDPINERGGPNLYAFATNDAINRVDFLGLYELKFVFGPNHVWDQLNLAINGYSSYTDYWTPEEEEMVLWAQDRAWLEALMIVQPDLQEYLDLAPDLYCDTRGRGILLYQIKYMLDTVDQTIAALRSKKKQVVRKSIAFDATGKALVSGFGNLYITDLFFETKESSHSRAVAFFHEVTHLIGRTDDTVADLPGRGHHEDARTYDLLFGADRAREIIERNNGYRINADLRACEFIYRRDGLALGATDP